MRKFFLTLAAAALTSLALAQSGRLEIFSWWAGDEGPALQALIDLYKKRYPNVEVINATVTGGAGVNAKAVLKTRMLGGDPPDSFQVHAGQELTGTWVIADRMEDLTPLFNQEGWMNRFPKGLIDLISYKGKIYSVPVNIHRSNVMWYVPAKLREWGVQPPKTWAEFLSVCQTLKSKGLEAPLALGENWTQQHLWESVALGVLGATDYTNLWNGKLRFNDPKVVAVWNTFGRVLDCANKDASGLSWQQAVDRVLDGSSAFNIMGDWAAGYLTTTKGLKPGEGFGWAPAPGTAGVFMMLSDSFGLPKGVKNRANVLNWLRLVGSKEGQDAFNPAKGSIPARIDADITKYGPYHKWAMEAWKKDKLVPSIVHGAAAKLSFMTDFMNAINVFATKKDVAATHAALVKAAKDAGLQK